MIPELSLNHAPIAAEPSYFTFSTYPTKPELYLPVATAFFCFFSAPFGEMYIMRNIL
jgi:hypothetical protein